MLFYVQGSGKTPYELKATGAGETFYLACSCPAGRKTGKQCKHARALLMGEVTALQEGSGDLVELAKLAAGSSAIAEAMDRPLEKMPHRPPEGASCVKSLYEVGCPLIDATDLTPQYSEEGGDWKVRRLTLHERWRNGNLKKGAAFELTWEEMSGDVVVQADGSLAYENVKPRARPYVVRGKSMQTVTRKKFEDAYDFLIKAMAKRG
ncbi:SWIM zinc finger [Octadecabacter temperatus]|uniref:Uncharacterized protein n=1 Tax=Octadecabacter temperatus TaxID=1458307 RepID=A0A0K0Y4L2_9RHOB|nr:SWIM zinc finger family protein [Octadecabacter temperatus]AKS45801.1 hypothetical protein OSB_12460 [Octadecabacter temperatus]SIO00836.1 SWIM zinc finger [Octadecabacter temperatus]